MKKKSNSIPVSLTGHASQLPSYEWCKLFRERMDKWLEARGQKSRGMQGNIDRDFRMKKEAQEENDDE